MSSSGIPVDSMVANKSGADRHRGGIVYRRCSPVKSKFDDMKEVGIGRLE